MISFQQFAILLTIFIVGCLLILFALLFRLPKRTRKYIPVIPEVSKLPIVSIPPIVLRKEDLMDPFSIVFAIASGVLSNLVSNMITDKVFSTSTKEVESEVEYLLQRYSQEQQRDFRQYQRQIFDEMQLLVRRDPNLELSDNRLKIVLPKEQINPALEQTLQIQLQQFQEIVKQRRKELGLIAASSADAISADESVALFPQGDVTWVQVPKPTENQWAMEFNEMNERIRRRRNKEILTDEQ